jgi:hypothetical protein
VHRRIALTIAFVAFFFSLDGQEAFGCDMDCMRGSLASVQLSVMHLMLALFRRGFSSNVNLYYHVRSQAILRQVEIFWNNKYQLFGSTGV